jgi:hypothetical protein
MLAAPTKTMLANTQSDRMNSPRLPDHFIVPKKGVRRSTRELHILILLVEEYLMFFLNNGFLL